MGNLSRLFQAAAVMAASGGSLWVSMAVAAVQTTYYVSPTGSESSCSQVRPCSLAMAQLAVEAVTAGMAGDLVVLLQAGTYTLSSTLTFTSADSGQNGHNVIYEAVPGQTAILSGGTSITGWRLYDESKNIYRASVPRGLNSRQIYVNGQRASLASAPATSVFGTMTPTSTGYRFTNPGPNSWDNTGNVDLIWSNAGLTQTFEYSLCPVSSIGASTITVQNPCFANGSDHSQGYYPGFGVPTAVENNYALLNEPGQFYIDTSTNYIYYIPRHGEDIGSAAVVVAGLQTIVNVAGTSTNPVHNLQFASLSFEYATWIMGNEGELDEQANILYTTDLNTEASLPFNVACHSCNNVSFSGNTFTHLGGTALGFDGGGQNNTVTGNVVTDVSGNGIHVGSGSTQQPAVLESGYVIQDNYVYNVAKEYRGGVGIFAGWVINTTVAHNEVWNVPYSGISLGWGWGDPSSMVNNHVDYNYVHDGMTSSLRDGGAIYVNGTQGSTPASTIQGNYIAQQSQVCGALYLDSGSSYWQVQNNVIGGYVPLWLAVQMYEPSANYNTVQNNYLGSFVGGLCDSPNGTNTLAGNESGLTSWPTGAQSIIAAAGLEPAYVGLTNGPEQSNVAWRKPVITSSNDSSEYAGSNANDGKAGSSWASAAGDTSASWQTDLGASYDLSDIQLLFRQDLDAPSERQNFQILVSNTPSLTSGYTVVCSRGPNPLQYQDRYDCPAPAGTWRYVSFVKGDASRAALAEVRAFGAQVSSGDSFAGGASSTVRSDGGGAFNWVTLGLLGLLLARGIVARSIPTWFEKDSADSLRSDTSSSPPAVALTIRAPRVFAFSRSSRWLSNSRNADRNSSS